MGICDILIGSLIFWRRASARFVSSGLVELEVCWELVRFNAMVSALFVTPKFAAATLQETFVTGFFLAHYLHKRKETKSSKFSSTAFRCRRQLNISIDGAKTIILLIKKTEGSYSKEGIVCLGDVKLQEVSRRQGLVTGGTDMAVEGVVMSFKFV